MKILEFNTLTNWDKARLLYKLFPKEMEGLLEHTNRVCDEIINNADVHRANWNIGVIDFEFWEYLSRLVKDAIIVYQQAEVKSSKVFIHLLYRDYQFLFMNHCIHTYGLKMAETKPDYALTIKLLFK